MTSKKAASLCIALGSALALFAAAAGLNRPTDKTSPAAEPASVQEFVANESFANAPQQMGEIPIRQFEAPAPVLDPGPTMEELNNRQGEINNALRPNVQPAPAPQEPNEFLEGENGEKLLVLNRSVGKMMQDLELIDPEGRVSVRKLSGLRMAAPRFGSAPLPADGVAPRATFGCPVATTAPAACGEEAYHMDGDFSPTFRDGYAFDRLFGVPEPFIGNQILESCANEMSLGSETRICGITVGYVTNSTGLIRIRVRMYNGDLTVAAGTPLSTATPVLDREFCAPGAPEYDPEVVYLLFATTQFADVTLPAGPYTIRYGLRDEFPVPNSTDPATNQFGGWILASPGFAEADGSFPGNNGSQNRFILIGAGLSQNTNQPYCGTAENPDPCPPPGNPNHPFQSVTLFYGSANYAGLYGILHTRDPFEGKAAPDKSSTIGSGRYDTSVNPHVWVESAPVACDIAGGSALSDCTGVPAFPAVPSITQADADTLANILSVPNVLGIDVNSPNYNTYRCADIDRNGRIDCNDWRTFQALCGAGLSVPASMQSAIFDTILGNQICAYNVNNRYTSGGTGGAPTGTEVHANIPFNIPDNNFTGLTNTQNIPDTFGSTNGVADLDVDLDIVHENNHDLLVKLAHSNITKTLVDQPNSRLWGGGNGFTGMRVLLDDGEVDGSQGGPPGGLNTNSIKFARSSFRVFGRFKPTNKLAAYVGRRVGGASDTTPPDAGTGVGDWRVIVSDRAGAETGRLQGWSLHIKLGPPILGQIDGGVTLDGDPIVDRYRTVGSCPTDGSVGTTYFAFGQPTSPILINAGNPIPPIPGTLLDINANNFTGIVSFRGEPVEPFVSDYDMVLQRAYNIRLLSPGPVTQCIAPANPPGNLNDSCARYNWVAMNLRSCYPIQVTYTDRPWPELWDVTCTLPNPGLGGQMTLYTGTSPDTATTGRYWAALVGNPEFKVSKSADPTQSSNVPTFGTLLNGYLSLEMSTGSESPGINPGCANATPTSCRIPFVTDPNRAGQALGAVNTSGIVPGDTSFVPNVNSTLTTFTGEYQARKAAFDDPGQANTNWYKVRFRAPKSMPLCPSAPVTNKTLPKELVRGTWTTGVSRTDLGVETHGCQMNTAPTTAVFNTSDCRNDTNRQRRIDRVVIGTSTTTIKLSQIRWLGGYINCDQFTLPANPIYKNNVDDPPYGTGTTESSTFQDHFTIEFFQDDPAAAAPGAPNFTAPLPHAPISVVGNGQTGTNLIGDARFRRIRRTGPGTGVGDLVLTVFRDPIRVYEYQFGLTPGLEEDVTATNGKFWIAITNNTLNDPPIGDTGDLCVATTAGTLNKAAWYWVSNPDATLPAAESRPFQCIPSAPGSGLRNMAFCIATGIPGFIYEGGGVQDNCAGESPERLHYLVAGDANPNLAANFGEGSIVINGESTAGLSLPFTRDRWKNVSTVFKSGAGNPDRYRFTTIPGNLLPNNTAVKAALQSLLGSKAATYNAQIDSLVCNTTGLSPVFNATSLQVDHVFAGKLDFDDPNVSGSIEQFCRQADSDLSEYGGPASTVTAKDALRNNLDIFGIALKAQNNSNWVIPPAKRGYVAFYVANSQIKDCNTNGRDDQLDIDCGLGNLCDGKFGSSDCNANGIPDDCDVLPVPTGGGFADCDNNKRPDICDPGCLPDVTTPALPNLCAIATCGANPLCQDVDSNGIPDGCQTDCDGDGIIDGREIQLSNGTLDCDSNGIPDDCQTGGLPYVAVQGNYTGSNSPGLISFEPAIYSLGLLQTGLPTSGPTGTGQGGWKTIIGAEINMPGFGGPTPTLYPATGALIVNNAGTGFAACTQPSIDGQYLEIRRHTSAGAHLVWSWGVLSPKMRSRVQQFTRFEIDLRVESGMNTNDFHTCVLISDNGPGFSNPNVPPVVLSGFGASKVSNTDWLTSLAVWTQNPETGTVSISEFGDFFPPDTCVKVRLEIDSASPNSTASARFSIDRTTGDGTNMEFLRSVRRFGTGFGGVPVRFAIGCGVNSTTQTNRRAWWDNARFQVATPFSVEAATCGGSSIRNGCRIRGLGVSQEPDCNCNGVPDACDVAPTCTGSTYSAHPTPQTTQSVTTTRPCSADCNNNGTPDECEVPVREKRTVMFHDFEQNTAQPFFTNLSVVVGQPTADPLVALAATGDPTANGNPAWFVPVVNPDTLPDLSNAPISTLNPCPVGGGHPANEQSIGLTVDLSRRVDGVAGPGGPWTVRSGTFNRPVQGIHFNRQRLTVDCYIQSGRATYQVRPIGDDPATTAFARNTVHRVRFARAGINYTNDSDFRYGQLGFLPTNQVQVAANVFNDGTLMFASVVDTATSQPITWPENQCFRLIIETDTCRRTTDFFPLTLGDDTLIGLDLNFDNIPDAGKSMRIGSFSQLMRGVDLITDNAASGNPSAPGAAFFDNVKIEEFDDHCDTPQCAANDPDGDGSPCPAVPGCGTCKGDMNGNNAVRGDDVQGWVRCLLLGPSITSGCDCADMNSDNSITVLGDRDLFRDKVRGIGDPTPACP